jgi:hypothetical protein
MIQKYKYDCNKSNEKIKLKLIKEYKLKIIKDHTNGC